MISHKIRIYPNKKQLLILKQSCGVSRFAYNWGLSKWNEMYNRNEKPSFQKIKLLFNKMKRTDKSLYWLYDVTKCSPEYALMDLRASFTRFFKKQCKHPQFHKKRIGKGSFSISNDKFRCVGFYCYLPKIGKVKMAEQLRFSGKVIKGTISYVANKWFLSVSVDYVKSKCKNGKVIGIDLGLKDRLITSESEKFNEPHLYKQINRIKKEQKGLSRKIKKSKNWFKQLKRLQIVWLKYNNKKKDWVEKITTYLSKKYQYICLEDLNIQGLVKNRRLSASFQKASLYRFVERLKTKADVLQVNRFFPSTQLCSNCGYKNERLTLKDGQWRCPLCNIQHDRDINAAKNILRQALSEVTLVDKKALAMKFCAT